MSVKKNTITNLIGIIAPLIAALYSIPQLISSLGDDGFSIILMIWALIGYFSLFDFGVGRSLTYEISSRMNEPIEVIGSFIKAGLIIVSISAFIGVSLVYIFVVFFIREWYEISPLLLEDTISAFTIAAIAIIPTTITSGLRGALEGLDKFIASNINRSILGVSIFLLPVISIKIHGESLSIIALYLLAARILVMFFSIWQLRLFIFSKAAIKPVTLVPDLLKYGSWVSLSGIISPLMVYGDRFLLGAVLPISSIVYYATPQEGLLRLLVIPGALASALFHDLSANKKNYAKVQGDGSLYLKKISLVMGAIVFIVILCAYPFYVFWINEDFANQAYIPTVIMSIGIFFNSLGLISHTTISALGHVKFIGLLHTIELIIFIPTFYILTQYFGIIGASLAWTLRVVIDFFLLKLKSNQLLKSNLEQGS
jgi:O-antigen/teichoic acid export membrane protein